MSYRFIATCHNVQSKHAAQYEIITEDNDDPEFPALTAAKRAYTMLTGLACDVVELRLYTREDSVKQRWEQCVVGVDPAKGSDYSVIAVLKQNTPDREHVENDLPGWTWASQHGYSVEAWRVTCRIIVNLWENTAHMTKDIMADALEDVIDSEIIHAIFDTEIDY